MLLSRSTAATRPCKAPHGSKGPASSRGGGATRPRTTNKGPTFLSSSSELLLSREGKRANAPRALQGGDDGCPFEALGVPADASSEEIKKAYRRQAAQ